MSVPAGAANRDHRQLHFNIDAGGNVVRDAPDIVRPIWPARARAASTAQCAGDALRSYSMAVGQEVQGDIRPARTDVTIWLALVEPPRKETSMHAITPGTLIKLGLASGALMAAGTPASALVSIVVFGRQFHAAADRHSDFASSDPAFGQQIASSIVRANLSRSGLFSAAGAGPDGQGSSAT